MISTEDRSNVLALADTWLRTPYHHKQMVRGAGVDCALFLYAVYLEAGLIPAFKFEDYPPDWMLHRSEERYLKHVMDYADQVEAPIPGDVVMYKFGRCFSHGAIFYSEPDTIIHSFHGIGVVYSRIDEGRLATKQRTYWRLR